jgi:hypothetical protein
VTIPNYLATFKRVVHELEGREKRELSEESTPLISHNSLISHPTPAQKAGDEDQASKDESVIRTLRTNKVHEGGACGKSELSEKRITRPFPYAAALDRLERRCPDYVEPDRWHQCIEDARRFLAAWGEMAASLGWTSRELFGLHQVPQQPAATYQRLSRYDATGLIWLLQGHPGVALTNGEAAIQRNGAVVVYRKDRKPAFGPLGDNLDDIEAEFTRGRA